MLANENKFKGLILNEVLRVSRANKLETINVKKLEIVLTRGLEDACDTNRNIIRLDKVMEIVKDEFNN